MSDLATATAERLRRVPALRSPSLAVTAVFFINGILFASWTAHIPHVKYELGLTDGTLGIALVGAPAGSILALLAAARLLPRFGSRRMVRVTLVGYCLAGPLVGIAGSLVALLGTLMLWGAFQSAMDVSMNTQAISVERRARRSLMPGFHGWWSLGAFAGAGVGAIGVAVGVSLSDQLLLLGIPCLLVAGWLATNMIPDTELEQAAATGPAQTAGTDTAGAGQGRPDATGQARQEAQDWPGTRRRERPAKRVVLAILVLGGISVADMLCEGAVGDWAAVYLRTTIHDEVAIAALGYTCYALAMVIVRLTGNRLLGRFAVRRLLPALAALATVALTVGLAVNSTPTLFLGFAGLGAGIAVVIPVAFTAAGRVPGINAGTAVSLVSACGWAGFVCGPPLIGQLADATSLRAALILLPVLTTVIAICTATSKTLSAMPSHGDLSAVQAADQAR